MMLIIQAQQQRQTNDIVGLLIVGELKRSEVGVMVGLLDGCLQRVTRRERAPNERTLNV